MKKKIKNKITSLIIIFSTLCSIFTGNIRSINAGSDVVVTIGSSTGYSVSVSNPDGHSEWNANYQKILIDGEVGFCIQPGYILSEGPGFTPSPYVQDNVSVIAYEGWINSNKTNEDYLATQFMIWESLGGTITSTNFSSYNSYKSQIQNKINKHFIKPSFQNESHEMNVGESISLQDKNNVLSDFIITGTDGLNVVKNGDRLDINATIDAKDNSIITLQKIRNIYAGTSLAYTKPGSQTVAKLYVKDPIPVSISIKVNKYGSLNIAKQDDFGNYVPNTTFKLSKNADMSSPIGTYTTGTNGIVKVEQLLPATYYVQEVSVPAHLVLDSTIRSIEVKPNETATFNASNKWKRGYIQVVKKDIDTGKTIVKANTTFSVYKQDGTFVQDITTNKDGTATTPLLLYGEYYLIEKNAPNGYVGTDANLKYTISEDGKTYTQTISNKRVSGSLNIQKEDSVTGSLPQGEATLQGAVYELKARAAILDPADGKTIYNRDAVVATLTTDKTASASVSNLYLGAYYLKEKTTSDGYTLDPTEYDVTLSYENQNVSVITKKQTVKEKVKSQAFEVIKISDNGSGEADILAGVEFTIKAQKDIDTAGSWEKAPIAKNAQGKPARVLVTDKKGYALSEELPYGNYVVRETKVPNDHYIIPDFKVKIDKDSREPQAWRVFNDKKFKAVVSIVKKDADSDKIITLSGAKFKIKNLDKDEYVGHWVWNPLPHYVDSWTTDENGSVMTDDVLDPGNYELEEVEAPDGYLLAEPIKFKIASNGAFETLPDGNTPVITIVMKDKKPMGNIKLMKTDKDTLKPLSKVQYQLSAAQDIIDPADGSIIYKKGSLISVGDSENGIYVTDELGIIEVNGLALGTYSWKESKALDGFVKDENTYTFELKQENDTQTIYTNKQELTNQKTKVEILKEDVNNNALEKAHLRLLDENGNVIKEWMSEKGPLRIEGLFVGKTYTLYEDVAPIGYVVSKPVTFTVENTSKLQEIKLIDNQIVVNKTDNKGNLLSGATLQVVSTKTKDIVDEWKTTKDVHYISNLLEGEEYILREVESPKGFVLAKDITFTASDKKEIQTISMIDKQVSVWKVDEDKNAVIGAKLQVISTKTKDIVDEWSTTNKKHEVSNLIEGQSYILREVEAPNGLLVADDIEFNVTSNKSTQALEMVDNHILTTIQVKKIDSHTKDAIRSKDFAFTVFKDKNCKEELTTANADVKEGTATFKLRYGEWWIKETKAPSGYQLSSKCINVRIDEHGVFIDGKKIERNDFIYEIEFENTKVIQPVVKTGDTHDIQQMYVYSSMICISLCGVIFILRRFKKETKQ